MTSRRLCQCAYRESERRRDATTLQKASDKDHPSPYFQVSNQTVLYCAHRASTF